MAVTSLGGSRGRFIEKINKIISWALMSEGNPWDMRHAVVGRSGIISTAWTSLPRASKFKSTSIFSIREFGPRGWVSSLRRRSQQQNARTVTDHRSSS